MGIFNSLAIFLHFLFCDGQQSFASHQNYTLWFYSLWWMVKGIWHLCFLIFKLLWNKK